MLTRRHFLTNTLAALPVLSVMPAPVFGLDVPEGAPPPLREGKGYLANVVTAMFNGPVEDVIAALQRPETGVLAHVEPTPAIPSITGLEPVVGAFPEVNAVRRVQLETGDSVIERVLRNDREAFSYQIWGFTGPQRHAISHIRGTFAYAPVTKAQTKVTWTYEIAPRLFLARPLIRRFLSRDFAPFMESGLMGAAAAYNARATG